MAGKTGGHLKALNAKRAVTVRTLKQSEKAITDSRRIKQDVEAAKAAGMWAKGMDREIRDQ